MSRVKGANTGPELTVRRFLWRRGYRYRLHRRDLPGSPDIVFHSRRKVIFVHGCFWHRHPGCKLARFPKSKKDFWVPKLERNRERDLENQRLLRNRGWSICVVWECELQPFDVAKEKLVKFFEEE
jgi:DNA mismatch endonuclease, patch repair protein